MSDNEKSVPTEGVDYGHTMVVWPARPEWRQAGAGASIGVNPGFDPVTGNGWRAGKYSGCRKSGEAGFPEEGADECRPLEAEARRGLPVGPEGRA